MTSLITRRELLSASAALALSGCARDKGTGFYGYALVADADDKSVSVIDLTAFRLAKTIPLGASPSAIIGTGAAFVLTPDNGTVHVIDANLSPALSRRLGDQINVIRLTPDKRSLIAVSRQSREFIMADAATLRITHRQRLSFPPAVLDISSTGYAAIAGGSDGDVALIHLATGRLAQASLPHAVGGITFRGDGKLLLAADLQGMSIVALDIPALRLVAELPLAMQPEHLCFSADQGQLFVSGAGMDGVAVIFPFNMLEVDQTLLAGHSPGAMACSANPAYLFVASNDGSSVCVINIDTRKQLGLVEVGGKPTFIATTPDSQYALILNETSGDMAVIHIPAIRTTSTASRLKTGTALFTMLNVGAKPVHAAIVSRAG